MRGLARAVVAVMLVSALSGCDALAAQTCSDLANEIVGAQESQQDVHIVGIYSAVEESDAPDGAVKAGWTLDLACSGTAVLSDTTEQEGTFQSVTDPDGNSYWQWQPSSL